MFWFEMDLFSKLSSLQALVFLIGFLGVVFNRKNVLLTLLSIELLFLGVNLNFIVFSMHLDDVVGQVFVFFILAIAATETSIGLALLAAYYRIGNQIEMESIGLTKLKTLDALKKKQKFQKY